MKNIIFITLICVSVLACKTETEKQAIKKTDDMLQTIDSLKKRLDAPEVADYRIIYDSAKGYTSFIKKLPADFERNDSVMDILFQYGVIEKFFKKLHSVHLTKLKNSLLESETQIANLKKDIENNILDEKLINRFIKTEDSILNITSEVLISNLKKAEENAEAFKKYHPLMQEFKKNIENK